MTRSKLMQRGWILALCFCCCASMYGSEGERLASFFDKAFEDELLRSPMRQSYLGIKTAYDQWDDISDGAARREYLINTQLLTALRTEFDYARLSPQDQLSYRLFERRCQQAIRDYPWRFHSYPVQQMFGWQSRIPAFLINIHQISDIRDAQAYVGRLRGIPKLVSQVIDQLESRRAKGIVTPQFVFPLVLQDCRNLLVGKPFDEHQTDCTLLADFRAKLDRLDSLSDVEKQRLLDQASAVLVDHVQVAYQQLIAYLSKLSAQATPDDGVWKFPNGEDYYRHALRHATTTEMTPQTIHEIGLAEVACIHQEMRAIMARVDFDGSLQQFFQFTRNDERFFYANDETGRQAYLTQAKQLIDAMQLRLDELFLRKPKAPMIVKRVEPFREASAGKAFYQPPAPNGTRPGTYYANLSDMSQMPIYQMEALAYHEGIPGHHMQISIAQELDGLPRFRRFGIRYTAYSEGWGLYCELVPKEIGCYGDPYSDFGRLAMELWRAARLVVDTGIHAKRWSRQQAIDYLTQHTPNPDGDCQKAIDRYIVMPGQATAYKIGMLKILQLRQAAQERLQQDFDLREFHDVLLRNGPLPLPLLEQQVEAWIVAKQHPSGRS